MKILFGALIAVGLWGCTADDVGVVADGLGRFASGYEAGVNNYQAAHPFVPPPPPPQMPMMQTGFINTPSGSIPYSAYGNSIWVGY